MLLFPGYWPNTYWPKNYWVINYWARAEGWTASINLFGALI